MKEGVLLLDKPSGKSSTEIVDFVKKNLRIRKAGHGGTLDPFATGILPICLGRATKIARFILEGDKEYEGVLKLGVETETYDLTGKELALHPVPDLEEEDIQKVFDRFIGELEQTPPPFSAAKLYGRPLYKYAREGLKPEKPPKKIEVLHWELLEYKPPLVKFKILCGKGTYIRSLVHEVGKIIGCGAALKELRRLRKGPFTLDRALTLEKFQRLVEERLIDKWIIPINKALEFMPSIKISSGMAKYIRQGRPLAKNTLLNLLRLQKVGPKPRVPWLRIITHEGDLVAVLNYPQDFSSLGTVKMLKVFPAGKT